MNVKTAQNLITNVVTDLTREHRFMNIFISMRGTLQVRDTCNVKFGGQKSFSTFFNADEDYTIHNNQNL